MAQTCSVSKIKYGVFTGGTHVTFIFIRRFCATVQVCKSGRRFRVEFVLELGSELRLTKCVVEFGLDMRSCLVF